MTQELGMLFQFYVVCAVRGDVNFYNLVGKWHVQLFFVIIYASCGCASIRILPAFREKIRLAWPL